MPVPSLAGLCRKTILANIDELSYVSTLPYEKCREILLHVKTAQQLAVIEDYSPQIVGQDSELWVAFIKKDFPVPMKRKNYQPENPRSWRQIYERYAKEEREAETHALAQLGATFAGLNKTKQENKTGISDHRLLRKVGGTARKRSQGFGFSSSTLAFNGGTRTANAVKRARREAKEVAAMKKLSSASLKPRVMKIEKAPESMRNEQRIKKQPSLIPHHIKEGLKRPRDEDDELARREARLLAAKKPKAMPKVLSDHELMDSDVPAPAAATAPIAKSGSPPSNAKKSKGIFSSAHGLSHQQNKVIVQTVGGHVSRDSPEKANKHPSSASPPSQPSSRAQAPRINTMTSSRSRVSSPGCEDFKIGKMPPRRRRSRSSSPASSLFGSPEPGSSAPPNNGRRSSFHSNDSRSSSPSQPAPHTKRSGTPEAAAKARQPGRPSTPTKRKRDEYAVDGPSSEAAPQPARKKKKVDIFMRPKKNVR